MSNIRSVVYVAGPMTGYESYNRPAFKAAADHLAMHGHIVLNPAVLPIGLSEASYMCIALSMLQQADIIYLLDGWELSKGAQAEYSLAIKLGLRVMAQNSADDNL